MAIALVACQCRVLYNYAVLARLDEVQEELLYYPGVGVGVGICVSKILKFLC